MKKKFTIVANWKCNPVSIKEAEVLFNNTQNELAKDKPDNVEIIVCPPFVYLEKLKKEAKSKFIALGAQNCFWQEQGAYTGEISAEMIKSVGANYVIVGHSERRNIFMENNEAIKQKVTAALKTNIKPILCFGETKKERENNQTLDVVRDQLQSALENVSIGRFSDVLLAYEPVWAIGTGDNCAINEAMTMLMFIKKELLKKYPKRIVENQIILYGGSVNSRNAKEYVGCGFNGLLVGGASLNSADFCEIINNVN
jgi:triosephosphate isomerase